MELKLDKEPVLITETVFDGQIEQGIELEHVLPDYYPDVFKLLKCTLTPRIVSYSVSENKLFIDGVVYVKVLYLSEGSSIINVVDQRFTYSKTADLSKPVRSPQVCIFPSVDYCTARAVSGRRIDVRGAVTLKVRVTGIYETELLCGVSGMGTEISTRAADICDDRLYGGSQYIVREDIETGAGGGISAVISSECTAAVTDTKVIADKVVVKGEAKVKALYLIKNSAGEMSSEVMEASVPLSRIIDLQGVTDAHTTTAEINIMDMSLEIKSGDDNENRTFGCDITVDCKVSAFKGSSIRLVNDLYSTEYESSFTVTPMKLEGLPRPITLQIPVKTEVEYTDGAIGEIFDAACDICGITVGTSDSGKCRLTTKVQYRLIGKSDDGIPMIVEKTDTIDTDTDVSADECLTVSTGVYATGISFGITDDSTAEIRAQITVNGLVTHTETVDAVNEITINEDRPKQKDTEYALRLYFADEGESVWDISKRYNTSAAAMIAENELDSESATVSGMILIPIV